jgi:hypothetical protein
MRGQEARFVRGQHVDQQRSPLAMYGAKGASAMPHIYLFAHQLKIEPTLKR